MSRLHQLPVLTTNLEVEVYLKIHLIWLWLLCSVIKKQSHNWYFKCFLRMWNISISSKPNRPCLNVQQWLVDVVLKIYNIYLLFDIFSFQFIPLITSWRNLFFFKISTIWLHWLTNKSSGTTSFARFFVQQLLQVMRLFFECVINSSWDCIILLLCN